MKTKELIRLLQEADPTGETECCVDNEDIHFVDRVPAYYDGTLQVFERDPAKKGFYDIVGVRFVRSGDKIKIRHMGYEDVIHNRSEVPIDTSCFGGNKESMDKAIEKVRATARRYDQGIFNHPDDKDE